MSVVAVKIEKSKIVICADSIVSIGGGAQEKISGVKLQQIDDIVIGVVGMMEEATLMFLYARNHKPLSANEYDIVEWISEFQTWAKAKTTYVFTFGSSFIIVYQKKAFVIEGFMVREIKDFYAIGAGQNFAITALHLCKSAKEAVEIACELSIYCEKPVNIFEVKL